MFIANGKEIPVQSGHGLLLIPYYFFGALGSLLLFILASRFARLRLSLSVLATMAVLFGIALVTVPLLAGWMELRAYSGRRMLVLAGLTFLLALIDAAVQSRLPLPLDRDLQEL